MNMRDSETWVLAGLPSAVVLLLLARRGERRLPSDRLRCRGRRRGWCLLVLLTDLFEYPAFVASTGNRRAD